jgi:hypothetical protein
VKVGVVYFGKCGEIDEHDRDTTDMRTAFSIVKDLMRLQGRGPIAAVLITPAGRLNLKAHHTVDTFGQRESASPEQERYLDRDRRAPCGFDECCLRISRAADLDRLLRRRRAEHIHRMRANLGEVFEGEGSVVIEIDQSDLPCYLAGDPGSAREGIAKGAPARGAFRVLVGPAFVHVKQPYPQCSRRLRRRQRADIGRGDPAPNHNSRNDADDQQ